MKGNKYFRQYIIILDGTLPHLDSYEDILDIYQASLIHDRSSKSQVLNLTAHGDLDNLYWDLAKLNFFFTQFYPLCCCMFKFKLKFVSCRKKKPVANLKKKWPQFFCDFVSTFPFDSFFYFSFYKSDCSSKNWEEVEGCKTCNFEIQDHILSFQN